MKKCDFCKRSYLSKGVRKCIYGNRCALSLRELKELLDTMREKNKENK